MNRPWMTVTAFAEACAAFVLPLLVHGIPQFGISVHISFGLSVVWLITVSYIFVRRRKGAWILLFGIPLVVYWPLLGAVLWYACTYGGDCA